nr:hypothetical protein Iba_chr06bCG6020 [Ipomoea batatas]GMD11638.1 hypothetical protein Iba_chr06fCG5660 [Ipomoea batatas]
MQTWSCDGLCNCCTINSCDRLCINAKKATFKKVSTAPNTYIAPEIAFPRKKQRPILTPTSGPKARPIR